MTLKMRRAAIVEPIRTGVGKYLGALKTVQPGDLAAAVIKALVQRTGLEGAVIDDVILAWGYGNGEAPCIGRWAALAAGLPESVPGMQLDRRCGSGLQAVIDAAMRIETGAADVVIAGGVESMSNVEYYSVDHRQGARLGSTSLHDRLTRGRVMSQPISRYGVISGMIETANALARDYRISREACDAYALRSHQRASDAWDKGLFDEELVPVQVGGRDGQTATFAKDEGIRRDATLESLASLKPLEEGGVVTAGNASQQNDAAAACLVVAEDKLDELGLRPRAWLHSWAVAGCDPARMGIGPVPAVEKLFRRSGLDWKIVDLIELNEAFAPQVLACLQAWGYDRVDPRHERLNVNGSGISLGHPIGATGGRILANLVRELERRDGRFGLETMCVGGGQGIAALFERAK